jgi:hypothetical protein
MSIYGGPKIVSSGLVLCIDAANAKNLSDGNMFTYSQGAFNSWGTDVFGSGPWPDFTITDNYAAAPDGSTTASRVQITGLTSGKTRYLAKSGLFSTLLGTFTMAFYAKSNTGSNQSALMQIVPYSGTVTGTSYQTVTLTTSWQQFSMTFNVTVAGNIYVEMIGFNGTPDIDILLWGAQLTPTASVAAYVKTTASAVSSTIPDLSNNGNTGTLIATPGHLNNAIVFKSANSQYINIPSSTSLQVIGDLTLSCWFNPTDYTAGRQGLIGRNGLNEYTITLEPSGNISFYFASSNQAGSYYNGASGRAFVQTNGVFQNLVITRNFTTGAVVIYKNGVQTDSVTMSGVNQPTATANVTTIGVGNGGYFNGSVGLFQIYNRALSATEVLQNFNALRGRYGI